MAESAVYTRRGFKGGAKIAQVAAGLSSGATSLTGDDLTTWAGVSTNGPFTFVIDRGFTTEEVCEATTLSGNNITGITRGLRGTTAVAHDPNCKIEHVPTDRDADEANLAVSKTIGKITAANSILISDAASSLSELAVPASRILLRKSTGNIIAGTVAELKALLALVPGDITGLTQPTVSVWYSVHVWAISGTIAVPSGDTDFLVPMFVSEGANEVVVLDKVRYVINSGTSATFKLQVNGSDATGFTGISCTTTAATTDPADVSLTDLDKLAPVVTAVSAAPKNMTIAVYLKHTVTLT